MLRRSPGRSCRLLRTWREGRAKIAAFSEDYGAVADGLLALHRATGELVWLDEAGVTWLSYNDPAWIAARHRIGAGAAGTATAMQGLLATVASAATAP